MLGGEFVEVDKAEADKADHFHMEEVTPQPSTRTPNANPAIQTPMAQGRSTKIITMMTSGL